MLPKDTCIDNVIWYLILDIWKCKTAHLRTGCTVTAELVHCVFGLTTGSGTDLHLALRTYGDYFISLLFTDPNNITYFEMNSKTLHSMSTVSQKKYI